MKWNSRYLAAGLLAVILLAAAYYYRARQGTNLEGIAYGNGRIEAQSIDIATRSSGRILAMPVEEGQMVEAGDIVAELDLNSIAASLAGAESNVHVSQQQRDEAASQVSQAESAYALAQKEYARAENLAREKAVSQSSLDQALNEKQRAESALLAAQQKRSGLTEAINVAQADVNRLKDVLRDQHIRAPVKGRIIYKLVESGEVVPAGGKIVTLLDLSNVYMSIFLPTPDIGHIALGEEAHIILDALPNTPIPAYISYISPEAQFTPRQVETRTEREKLTFRVKVRIPEQLLNKHLDAVNTGLPGMAYIKIDKDKDWPEELKVDPSLMREAQDTEVQDKKESSP